MSGNSVVVWSLPDFSGREKGAGSPGNPSLFPTMCWDVEEKLPGIRGASVCLRPSPGSHVPLRPQKMGQEASGTVVPAASLPPTPQQYLITASSKILLGGRGQALPGDIRNPCPQDAFNIVKISKTYNE